MYKWYEAISDDSLEQGDIFFGYPLVNSNLSEQDILDITSKELPDQLSHEADIIISDVIVCRQTKLDTWRPDLREGLTHQVSTLCWRA